MQKVAKLKLLAVCAVFGAATMSAMPASAQVMARGYYHHLESRASFFISEVTEADQISTEMFTYHVEGNEPMDVPAWRHSYLDSRGTQHHVTVVDFAPYYEKSNSTVQYSMTDAATNYRQMGEVILDQGTRSDRIPSHILNIQLDNGNVLFVVLMLPSTWQDNVKPP